MPLVVSRLKQYICGENSKLAGIMQPNSISHIRYTIKEYSSVRKHLKFSYRFLLKLCWQLVFLMRSFYDSRLLVIAQIVPHTLDDGGCKYLE